MNSDGVNVFDGNSVEETGVPIAQMDKNGDDAKTSKFQRASGASWRTK